MDAAGEAVDLSKEEEFNAFLEADHPDGYDADISWYRWETEIDNKTLSENLNQALAGRIAANPNAVLTRLGSRLESRTIKTIGRIRGIDVLERNEGGAVTKLQIRGQPSYHRGQHRVQCPGPSECTGRKHPAKGRQQGGGRHAAAQRLHEDYASV